MNCYLVNLHTYKEWVGFECIFYGAQMLRSEYQSVLSLSGELHISYGISFIACSCRTIAVMLSKNAGLLKEGLMRRVMLFPFL